MMKLSVSSRERATEQALVHLLSTRLAKLLGDNT